MNADLERPLLGVAMAGADIGELANIINPSDFYHPTHEFIWQAILRVHEAGGICDPLTVRDALGHVAPKANIDPMVLLDAVSSAPIIANGSWYAEQVAAAAGLRRIVHAGQRVQQIGSSESIDIAEAREMARQAVDDATVGRVKADTIRLGDILPDVIDIAENGTSPALSTPWPDIDRLITGLAPGRLVVVGSRPGVGKSIMGTNLALQFAAVHKHAVLLASMEMGRIEVGQRLVAAHARVNLSKLMNGDTGEADWDSIRKVYDEVNAMPITIDDKHGQTVTSIRASARGITRERGDLALIVVDYLQLMDAGTKGANQAEDLGYISRGLKMLARETNSCVVAMAQVNRESLKNGDGRPKQSDLKGSGSIEADADQVILLHRPSKETPELEAIVDKNRHGPEGVAMLQVQGHYARLSSARWMP